MDDDRLGHASLDRLCWEETGYGKEDTMKSRQITLAPAGFTDPDARPSDIHTTDAERFWAAPDWSI